MCNLYERIQTACTKKGITVSAMCLNLGMSKSVMSDLKSGRKKTLAADTVAKIADYLDVSTDFLLGKEKAPTVSDERIDMNDVDVAFYGDFKELSDDDKATIRDMVRIMRQRRANKP